MATESRAGNSLDGLVLPTAYQLIFDAIPSPHVLLTPDFKIVTANDAYCNVSMTTRAQLAGHDVFEIFPDNPNDPDAGSESKLRASLERVLATRAQDITLMQYDIRRPAVEGGAFEQRYWSLVSKPVFEDGRLIYILIHTEDVTEFTRLKQQGAAQHRLTTELQGRNERMEAEIFQRAQDLQALNEQLRDTAERLKAERARQLEIFMQAPAFIAILRGPTHIFEFANLSYQRLVDNRDILGKTVGESLPEVTEQGFVDLLNHVYQTGEPFLGNQMRVLLERDGALAETFLDFIYKPIVETDGAISGIFVQGIDVTDLKHAEDERADLLHRERQARAKAEEANALKLQFMGMISHELRTPLASIKGFISTVLAPDIEWEAAQRDEFLTIADSEADKMTELIDQLLDATQLQAGTLRIRPVPTMVNEILSHIRATLDQMTRQHALELDVPDTLPPVLADDRRISQVFTNLVGNAVKFSPHGAPIRVAARVEGSFARIDVTDTGHGIAVQDQPYVFEAFRQSLNRPQAKGAGLGLAICKGIVEAHGGTISVVENHPQGTIMSFTLPLAT